jgi:multidrug efflux pump subunit AcrB
MRRPISVCVLVAAFALTAFMAVEEMPRDILPNLGVPVLYVAQSYGGMDASQMESYLTYFYESVFLFIDGVEHFESKNIQSIALLKIQFNPGTDMAQAMAQTVALAERARASMPPGTLPPFMIRFDAGSEPVGDLVFTTSTKTISQVQNLALNYVRPLFASLPGVSSPAPFGAGARTIVIEVDPKKMAANDLSPEQITNAIAIGNTVVPSGNITVGSLYPIVALNGVAHNPSELLDIPLRPGFERSTVLGDVGRIVDTSDIQTGYAIVNGHRTIYIPITKRADASTLTVVDSIKANLAKFQSVLPDDVKVSFEFDQSGYVRTAISTLFVEAMLGAILTGLMVLLFLRDIRSVLIVIINIPLALLFSILCLWMSGQTVNIMTLGGLALAVGILVDETTVTIENIHAHLAMGATVARASLDATNEILKPAFLSLLCVLSVFIPSFFMKGVTHALFVPLTMAVGFSMIGSFMLSRTLVPVLSVWLMKSHGHNHAEDEQGFFFRFQTRYSNFIKKIMPNKKKMVMIYLLVCFGMIALCGTLIGREIFPTVQGTQFKLRLKGPTGTAIDYTEKTYLKVLDLIKEKVGADNVETTVGFVGTQPPNYALNMVYLWTAGPQEAVMEVALKESAKIKVEDLKEYLRQTLKTQMPETEINFEPSNLVDRTMSQGSSTPIEIGLSGSNIESDSAYAEKVRASLSTLDFLRDVQIRQRLDYPEISVNIDRGPLGHRGMTVSGIGQGLIPATSSSRYVSQNFWRDPTNGVTYALQVQVPQQYMMSAENLGQLPIQAINGDARPLHDFAKIENTFTAGEYDRYNMQRTISVIANLHGIDLGHAAAAVNKKLQELEPQKPKGVFVRIFGQMPALEQMFKGLSMGLGLAIIVVFLLLGANFESLSVSFTVLSTAPAVIMGSLLMLLITRSTLNIQSFMGIIMAIGVAVANAILLITFAERFRKTNNNSAMAALEGARTRLRPILMTSGAMLVGMLPMASGLSDGGEQMAPLGRAVLGGVLASTVSTLVFLPLVFAWVQEKRTIASASLDPDDEESKYYSVVSPNSASV